MSRHRAQSDMRGMTNIDVTPLVDLTFLLLIVFMITAPVLEKAVDVKPPQYNATAIEDVPHRIINLDRNGTILLGDQAITEPQLASELLALRSSEPELVYFIRADESRPYGEVMRLMKVAKDAGITDVSLVTSAEESR